MVSLVLFYLKNALSGAIPIFICWLVIRFLYILFFRPRAKKVQLKYEAMLFVFAAYIIVLLEITVVRFSGFIDLFGRISQPYNRVIQLVPFIYTLRELKTALWAFLYPVLGNIVWFLPFGFLLPYIYPKPASCLKVTIAGAALSCCIEVLQWVFGSGISDIDDIIFNTAGAALGYGFYCILRKKQKRRSGYLV